MTWSRTEMFRKELNELLIRYGASLSIEEVYPGSYHSGDVRIVVDFETDRMIADSEIILGSYYDGDYKEEEE